MRCSRRVAYLAGGPRFHGLQRSAAQCGWRGAAAAPATVANCHRVAPRLRPAVLCTPVRCRAGLSRIALCRAARSRQAVPGPGLVPQVRSRGRSRAERADNRRFLSSWLNRAPLPRLGHALMEQTSSSSRSLSRAAWRVPRASRLISGPSRGPSAHRRAWRGLSLRGPRGRPRGGKGVEREGNSDIERSRRAFSSTPFSRHSRLGWGWRGLRPPPPSHRHPRHAHPGPLCLHVPSPNECGV